MAEERRGQEMRALEPKYPLVLAMRQDLETRFTYHAPKPDQGPRYQGLREMAHFFAITICENVPLGRERALALTHLEDCVMWANAGIARNE